MNIIINLRHKLSQKLSLFLVMLWAAVLLIPKAQAAAQPVVYAVLFYSPSCGHCHKVITEVLMPMTEAYGDQLQIAGIDTTQPAGSTLYQAVIQYYQIPQERQGVPTLIVGDIVLVGSSEIPAQFPGMVEQGLAAEGIAWPTMPQLAAIFTPEVEPANPSPPTATPAALALADQPAPASVDEPPVYLAYFFDPTCLECARVEAELDELRGQYPNLVVREFNINHEAALNEAMSEKYGVSAEHRLMAPMVFIGETYLTAEELNLAHLQSMIEEPATAQAPPPWDGLLTSQPEATERIVERFKHFGVLAVAGAGLLDGINPCAFTTIIFFVSYLTLVGRKGAEILLVGAAFTLAVFLTYLMMGLGLAEVVRQISSFNLIGQIIYGVTALICLVLAGVSIWDYIKIRRGQLKEIALQLPQVLKKRIHQTIRSQSRAKSYIMAAFVAGVLVSLFELACTGQVYLPTIVFVTGVASLRLTAMAYLVLYNLMFITPLVAVFLVTYLGANNRQLIDIFQTKAGLVKLLTALLFGGLGLWLGYMVLGL